MLKLVAGITRPWPCASTGRLPVMGRLHSSPLTHMEFVTSLSKRWLR